MIVSSHIFSLECSAILTLAALLVSCGTMSKKKLQADVVKVTSEPPPTALGGASMRRIIVKYTESVKWIFTPEECPTWFVSISRGLSPAVTDL